LDNKLPETYDRALFTEKCDSVFETMLTYASQGMRWVVAALAIISSLSMGPAISQGLRHESCHVGGHITFPNSKNTIVTAGCRILRNGLRQLRMKPIREIAYRLNAPVTHVLVFHSAQLRLFHSSNLSGAPKATLGEILKQYPDLLPKPLDTALSQIWGYASNEARHVQEGRDPIREEAELVVGLAAVVTTYLIRKSKPTKP
jgi:hypothetical protein